MGNGNVRTWLCVMGFIAIFLFVSGEDYKDAKSQERAYCHGTCGDKQ